MTILLETHDLGVAGRIGRVALRNRRLIGYRTASAVLVAEVAASHSARVHVLP